VTDESHWSRWHDGYADPGSDLSLRLTVVQSRLAEAVDRCPPGPVRIVSLCAGQAHDVVGALAEHPRRSDVVGRLVELDAGNAEVARGSLSAAGLTGLTVTTDDAGSTDACAGAVPSDVLLLCGIFGNVPDADIAMTVANASRLCAPAATVLWTRHRRSPDLTPTVRSWFRAAGFDEVAFDSPGPERYAVGTARLVREPLPYEPGLRLFAFR
jgi:hypothetical protein